ncbi:hypothetical protein DPMN_015803 [Dreissena polymorpha]|uniref:Uncharacterized protein n=1 Tax=Dreissena polymorpha TaxID=45954 RepID=A0A9D4NBZ2_DREPO|nr:hypothetical protein DPMN_015803 [Dreissena polymorpha]
MTCTEQEIANSWARNPYRNTWPEEWRHEIEIYRRWLRDRKVPGSNPALTTGISLSKKFIPQLLLSTQGNKPMFQIAPDGRTERRTDGRTTPKQYPSAYGGG